MSATVPRPSSVLWPVPDRRSRSRPQARANVVSMGDVSMRTRPARGDGDGDASPELHAASLATQIGTASHSDLRFDRLQPPDPECNCGHKRVFGRFVAREALLDEEFWSAAWLRAESHWEEQPYARHVESYKRKFAEQEFAAIKRRCKGQHAGQCTCIVVERTRASVFCSIYRADRPRFAYVANLCVARHARRQGVASNMLYSAAQAAKSYGVDQMFVHVHKDNVPAKRLYEKLGFQMIGVTMPDQEQKKLMCLTC